MSRKTKKSKSKPILPARRPLQLLLENVVSPECDCSSNRMLASMGRSGLRCAEAPWACPKEVPPARNTGVHGLGSAERQKA
jgi:hypothetical protein